MKLYILFLLIISSFSVFGQEDNLSQNQKDYLLQEKIEKLQTDYSKIAEFNSSLKIKVRELEDSLKAQSFLITSLQNQLGSDLEGIKTYIIELKKEYRKTGNSLKVEAEKLSTLLNSHEGKINSLEKLTDQNSDLIKQKAKELGIRIRETGDSSEQKYASLGSSLSQNKIFGFSAVLALAFLSVIGFVFLRRRAGTDKSQLTLQIQDTKKQIEEEGIKLDSKLVGILETQLKLMTEERASSSISQEETDHSLALKVADEIVRIEKNLGQMDEGTKGLKQLGKAVERIKDNFASNGYEMVNLLGKSFDDGMKLVANFRPDDSLKTDERIITRIIKPQVNYKGQMIQSAQVEVSQGE